jgi:hypothetical protein
MDHLYTECDGGMLYGGAGAQAGVLHIDGRRAEVPLHTSPAHTRLASVQRVKARAARCFSFSTRRIYCELQRRGCSAVQTDRISRNPSHIN